MPVMERSRSRTSVALRELKGREDLEYDDACSAMAGIISDALVPGICC
jgi:hypothetical protein